MIHPFSFILRCNWTQFYKKTSLHANLVFVFWQIILYWNFLQFCNSFLLPLRVFFHMIYNFDIWFILFHLSLDATEHNCRTYIQRSVSVSNFPLGYHGLHQFQTQFGQSQNFPRFKVCSCFYRTVLTRHSTGQIYRHFYFFENFTEQIYLYFSRFRILPGLFL